MTKVSIACLLSVTTCRFKYVLKAYLTLRLRNEVADIPIYYFNLLENHPLLMKLIYRRTFGLSSDTMAPLMKIFVS